jgi:hypothetical protein
VVLDIRDVMAGLCVCVGAVAYVREDARGRDETMVDSSTAAGAADGTGTTGVLKRMARERFENSMLVVFVCCVCGVSTSVWCRAVVLSVD